jgi:hypothetical protein
MGLELKVRMFEPKQTSMTEADFSNNELRESWTSYKRAVDNIEDKIKNHGFTSPGWRRLIERHKERMTVLEQAQRVLNHHRLSQVP